MLKVNERTTETVAALLCNNIYQLGHPSEGAWCVEERHDDPAYLAFAKGLIQAVRDNPGASDEEIIQRAEELTNQQSRGNSALVGWRTIVIDQEYAYLPDEAAKYLYEIRPFIIDPLAYTLILILEGEFLKLDEDVDKETVSESENN